MGNQLIKITGSMILKPKLKDDTLNHDLCNIVPSLSVDKINKLQTGTDNGLRSIQHHIINYKDVFIDHIRLIIIDMTKSLNLEYNLNKDQINQIPELLNTQEFYPLTVEDIALCCYRIKTGFYGSVRGRLNIPDFFIYLRKYTAEKLGLIYEENDQLKSELYINSPERLSERKDADLSVYRQAMDRYKAEILHENGMKEHKNNEQKEK